MTRKDIFKIFLNDFNILNYNKKIMPESNQTPDFAQMLAWAAPVSNDSEAKDINLSSSYLWNAAWNAQGGAFISNASIEDDISNISESAEEAINFAKEYGLQTEKYDPLAEEKAKKAAEEKAKKAAEEKAKAEKMAAQKAAMEAKKAEFIKFLNGQSEKDRKLWYSRWVIAGILFSFGIILISIFVWAKWFNSDMKNLSQKVDNYVNGEKELISTHILTDRLPQNIHLTTNDIINNAIKLNDLVDFGEMVLYYSTSALVNGEYNSNTTIPTPIDNSINIIAGSNTEETTVEAEPNIEEPTVETDNNTEDSESESDENTANFEYTLTHTEDESEANRVISANCDSLSCGDYTQASDPSEIVFCTEFSIKDTLWDTETRIWRSGKCRYKDSSELAILLIE